MGIKFYLDIDSGWTFGVGFYHHNQDDYHPLPLADHANWDIALYLGKILVGISFMTGLIADD